MLVFNFNITKNMEVIFGPYSTVVTATKRIVILFRGLYFKGQTPGNFDSVYNDPPTAAFSQVGSEAYAATHFR